MKDIVIHFKEIAIFFDELNIELSNQQFLYDFQRSEYIDHYFNKYLTEDDSIPKDYLLSCYNVIRNFSTFLDAKCLRSDIDLILIQKELEIFLFRERNEKELISMGYLKKSSSEISGFKCELTGEQIINIFNYIKENGIIDQKTTELNFKALLNNKQLPSDFIKIRWILLWRNKPHQQALRDFFEAVLGKDNVPSDKKINDYFSDKHGNPIQFSKRHGNSNYLMDFENVIKQ